MLVTSRQRLAVVGLLLAVALSACARVPGVYVYEAEGSAGPAAAAGTDAKTFVAENWTAKIVPTVQDQAVEVTEVAAAIEKDPAAAGAQYGHQAGTGSPFAFMVKGTGAVLEVDREAPTGPVTVKVDGAGDLELTIATGPVIAGTAIRDAVKFISFGDFTNQIDYQNVANEINNQVKTEVVGKVDLDALKGKKVSFHGAFSALAPGSIFLVPTELTVTP